MAKNPKTPKTTPTLTLVDDGTGNPVQPVHKKRGRTHLTQADKDHMQACRKEAAEAKQMVGTILTNDGITDPQVWAGLPPSQFDLIAGTVKTVQTLKKNAARAAAKAQYLAACTASGETPDAALIANVPDVAEPKRHKYSEAEKAELATARTGTADTLTLGLLDERASDHRVWMDVPSDKLNAIAGVLDTLSATMAAKRVSAAKAALEALA